MIIILGLGNPGPKYLLTRHNAGFRAVDCISTALKIPLYKMGYHSFWGKGKWAGQDIVLAKPMTYMNNSGLAGAALCHAFNTTPENLLVAYDDMDLPLGSLRLRPKGGSGGHNGIKSLIYHLQTEAFPRLRIGIGHAGDVDVVDYVLNEFTKEEADSMEELLKVAVQAAAVFAEEGILAAMNRFNSRTAKKTLQED